jgi:hypothetical protein
MRHSGFSRPKSRERIETMEAWATDLGKKVSPGRKAGSGLKQNLSMHGIGKTRVSPGRKAGSGLKQSRDTLI